MLLWPLQVPPSQIKQQIRLRISSLDGGSENCFLSFKNSLLKIGPPTAK